MLVTQLVRFAQGQRRHNVLSATEDTFWKALRAQTPAQVENTGRQVRENAFPAIHSVSFVTRQVQLNAIVANQDINFQ